MNKPILQQRKYWRHDTLFSKPLLSKIPLRYNVGHHSALAKGIGKVHHPNTEQGLYMIHLHSFDYNYCIERESAKYKGAITSGKKDESGLGMNGYSHNQLEEILNRYNVCGMTMLKGMRAPTGEYATQIPSKFHSIDI